MEEKKRKCAEELEKRKKVTKAVGDLFQQGRKTCRGHLR
jgi:hypothetical protein